MKNINVIRIPNEFKEKFRSIVTKKFCFRKGYLTRTVKALER